MDIAAHASARIPHPPFSRTLLAALEERDCITRMHCDRVCVLTLLLGPRCGLHGEALDRLANAALLHDIGKIGIPDAVLHKHGPLNPDERRQMQTHCVRGERLVLATGRVDAPAVATLVRQHHEAWDGSGYPDGLCGEAIPLSARILCTVDAYDALTSDRPYRPSLSHGQAMQVLQEEAGRRIAPDVFDELLAVEGRLEALAQH